MFKRKRARTDDANSNKRQIISSIVDNDEDEKKTDNDSDITDDNETTQLSINSLKLLQKHRLKSSLSAATGLNLSSDNFDSNSMNRPNVNDSSSNSSRLLNPSISFAAEARSVNVGDEQMKIFIEKEIQQRRVEKEKEQIPINTNNDNNTDSQNINNSNNTSNTNNNEFSVDRELLRSIPSLRRRVDEDESADRWLRGLVEIDLPLEQKIKNIDRTEKAKENKLRSLKTSNVSQTNVPVNFSANFMEHKSQWDQRAREEFQLKNSHQQNISSQSKSSEGKSVNKFGQRN